MIFSLLSSSQFYLELGQHSWTLTNKYPSGELDKATGSDNILVLESHYETIDLFYGFRQWGVDSGSIKEGTIGTSITF